MTDNKSVVHGEEELNIVVIIIVVVGIEAKRNKFLSPGAFSKKN